jgi:hypothetical protein
VAEELQLQAIIVVARHPAHRMRVTMVIAVSFRPTPTHLPR